MQAGSLKIHINHLSDAAWLPDALVPGTQMLSPIVTQRSPKRKCTEPGGMLKNKKLSRELFHKVASGSPRYRRLRLCQRLENSVCARWPLRHHGPNGWVFSYLRNLLPRYSLGGQSHKLFPNTLRIHCSIYKTVVLFSDVH